MDDHNPTPQITTADDTLRDLLVRAWSVSTGDLLREDILAMREHLTKMQNWTAPSEREAMITDLHTQLVAERDKTRDLHRRTQQAESRAQRKNRRLHRQFNLYRSLYHSEGDATDRLRTRCAELEKQVKELEASRLLDAAMGNIRQEEAKKQATRRLNGIPPNVTTPVDQEVWNRVTPETRDQLRGLTVKVRYGYPSVTTYANVRADGFYDTVDGIRIGWVTDWCLERGRNNPPAQASVHPNRDADGWYPVEERLWTLARGLAVYIRIDLAQMPHGPKEELARVGHDGFYTRTGRYVPFHAVTHAKEA